MKRMIFLLLMLFSSTSIFPMQTIRGYLGLNLKQEIPKNDIEITKENLKKFPQYRNYFIKNALKRSIINKNISDNEISYLFNEYKFAIENFTKTILLNWELFTQDSHSSSVRILSVIFKHDISQLRNFLPKLIFETDINFLKIFIHNFICSKHEFDKLVTNELKFLIKKYYNQVDQFIISLKKDKSFVKTISVIFHILTQDQKSILRTYILNNKFSNIFPLPTVIDLDLYPESRSEYENYLIQNFEYCLSDTEFYIDFFSNILIKNPKIILNLEKKIINNLKIINSSYLKVIITVSYLIGEINFAAQILLLKDFTIIDFLHNEDINNFLSYLKHNDLLLSTLKKLILSNPKKFNQNNIDALINYFTDEEKNKIKSFYQEDEINNPKFTSLLKNKIAASLYSSQNDQTQSKQHLLKYRKFLGKIDDDTENFILSIYAQEKVEHDNGNYVFYHGRAWTWNFFSDIYKQLWNIIKKDSINDNFQFLRFGIHAQKNEHSNYDLLFMNSAIFGNLSNLGSCSFIYWLNNVDQSVRKNLPNILEQIFKAFNLKYILDKYQNDLKNLKEIHEQVTPKGEILMISLPSEGLSFVQPIDACGGIKPVKIKNQKSINTQEILDAIKNNPNEVQDIDQIEWGLSLGEFNDEKNSYKSFEYPNDPDLGPKIYSFYLGDEDEMQKYRNLRDEIFEKIKNDIKNKNTKIRSKL